MNINKEEAVALAVKYLNESGFCGLIPVSARLVAAGDPLSSKPDRDLWIVRFDSLPKEKEPGAPDIEGGVTMVTIDPETLEFELTNW